MEILQKPQNYLFVSQKIHCPVAKVVHQNITVLSSYASLHPKSTTYHAITPFHAFLHLSRL